VKQASYRLCHRDLECLGRAVENCGYLRSDIGNQVAEFVRSDHPFPRIYHRGFGLATKSAQICDLFSNFAVSTPLLK